jgi:hydrogenase large subunit
MTRISVGPFNRVEGDLEVQLEIAGGRVREAYVKAPLYRGFEQILQGKDPRDTLVIAPRVCGICSIAQSMAAARALADLAGLRMPPNAELATNLVLACENVADHLTHFYLFFMPDFARPVYAARAWSADAEVRFRAITGTATARLLPARAQLLHIMGILAGKWPHSLSLQPGGTTRPVQSQERVRLLAILGAVRRILERELFGDSLDRIVALCSVAELEDWAAETPGDGDLRRFLRIAADLGLSDLGHASDRFMSYGGYAIGDTWLFSPGVWDGRARALDLTRITEDVCHSWMSGTRPLHPSVGVTQPDADKGAAYTWCKAPRLGGQTIEVGALARQLIAGHPLIGDLVERSGGSVSLRVIARLLEAARVLLAMEDWVKRIRPGEPFCVQGPLPDEGMGVGLVEAARGGLGHWLAVRRGRILNDQIIAPTTWNFSPRDAAGIPGPVEEALVGTPVHEGERAPVAVQHVVRSFDPCMVCTVH